MRQRYRGLIGAIGFVIVLVLAVGFPVMDMAGEQSTPETEKGLLPDVVFL